MTRRVLGIDSASGACSAALLVGGATVANRFEIMQRGQAEALAPMVDGVMNDAGVTADDLDLIGVTVGPGAFTGVRIGLAAARALGLASNTPVAGITTFSAVAAACPDGDRDARALLVVIESRRDDHFLQLIGAGGIALAEPRALDASDVPAYVGDHVGSNGVRLIGDGAARLFEAGVLTGAILGDGPGLPDARHVAALAARVSPEAMKPPIPLYLRPPDVAIPAGT